MSKKNILLTSIVVLIVSLVLLTAISFAALLVDSWTVDSKSEWNSVFSSASQNTTVNNANMKIEDQRWQLEHTRNTKNISLIDSAPEEISWKRDGTKLYITGREFDAVHEYIVSEPWNIKSATPTGNNVSTQDRGVRGIFWKPDGTKMYEVGGSDEIIYEYVVPDPWNISSAVYSSPSRDGVSISTERHAPKGISWKRDGTKLYDIGRTGSGNNYINQYKVSDPWNLSSAVYDTVKSLPDSSGNVPEGMFWKPDGKTFYTIADSSHLIREYNVSEPWNITTATYTGNRIATEYNNPTGVAWKTDGTKLYHVDVSSGELYESDVPFPDSGIFVSEWKTYNGKRVAENITQSINTGSGSIEVKIEAYDSSTASTSETNWLSFNSNGTVTKQLGNIEGDKFRVKYRLKK